MTQLKINYEDIDSLKHVLQTLRNRLIDGKPSAFYINSVLNVINEFLLKLED